MKHLPKFGWDVTAITAGFGIANSAAIRHAEYVETGYVDVKGAIKRFAGVRNGSAPILGAGTDGTRPSALRRIIAELSSVALYPDDYVGWLPYAVHATRKLIAGGEWDALLTSAPPMTTNIAAALSHQRLPWIADLRDLWAENDSSERTIMQRLFDDPLERTTLSHATALTAASEPSAARFRSRYPGIPCFPIYNGFDADEWEPIEFRSESKCTFLYAGQFYGKKRDPSILFAALRAILDQSLASTQELQVDFYAPREPWLKELIARYRLNDIVRVHGFVERDHVLAAERRADRLLVLAWDGPTAEGVVAGKLFEYFGARRPVLAIGGPARFAVDDLLRETGAGVRCTTIDETKADVLAALADHRTRGARIIDESAVKNYRGDACAKRFAEVLDLILASPVKA